MFGECENLRRGKLYESGKGNKRKMRCGRDRATNMNTSKRKNKDVKGRENSKGVVWRVWE